MAIYLPGTAEGSPQSLEEMTPREIVAELDKYVVGQAAAKRAVAIALRNRARRQKLTPEMAEEIMPRNILMIGSTGVGKTEIARRLAKLTNSPFLKVEASKFTEVGYVGRDVESMIRDLVENAIDMVREEKLDEIEDRAELAAEERLLALLVEQAEREAFAKESAAKPESASKPESSSPAPAAAVPAPPPSHEGSPVIVTVLDATTPEAIVQAMQQNPPSATAAAPRWSDEQRAREREHLLMHLREGRLDDRMVELETRDRQPPQVEVMTNQPPDEVDTNGIKEMFSNIFSQRTRRRAMKVAEAFDYLVQEEESRLLDMDQVVRIAIERTEDAGIVFLDEIDKIAGREGGHGPDISREGVQRDILPIVEGTTVNTKYGNVATDHILFIAAGAFHVSKPSDLIPELQGRFPIRVELQSLTVEDFLRILTEPHASLVKQAIALLETEGLKLEFGAEALAEMARFAFTVNEQTENIGARRLHTILEKVLEEISFEAPDIVKVASDGVAASDKLPSLVERSVPGPGGEPVIERALVIDRAYVERQVAGIVKNQDLSRYIL
jgi:ATP-dependent HslUV protease ATP-binding subunit HslU